MAELELLYQRKVSGLQSTKHKANLKCQINSNTPHFEGVECFGEPSFKGDNQFLIGLHDVDKVEDISKRVNGTRRIKVLINVHDHLESLFVKAMFLDN